MLPFFLYKTDRRNSAKVTNFERNHISVKKFSKNFTDLYGKERKTLKGGTNIR